MESQTLALILSTKANFEQARSIGAVREGLSDLGRIVYDACEAYYERDTSAESIDQQALHEKLVLQLPSRKKAIDGLFALIPSDVSHINLLDLLKERRKAELRLSITHALVGRGTPFNEVKKLLDSYVQLEEELQELDDETLQEEDLFIGPTVRDITGATRSGNRIRIAPAALDKRLNGGVLAGHHIVVFGRPEVGKSAFVLNMAYGFLRQGKRVLYVGNEDPAVELILRLMRRITGMCPEELEARPEEAEGLLKESSWENFCFVETEAGNFKQIEKWIDETKPDILILDQLRNLQVDSESRVLQLEAAAREARRIGKRHNLVVVSVTQAGDSGDGKRMLGMGDVDFSNTGIPGACDLMIGIGMDTDLERISQRCLSFPKNKISGNKDPMMITLDGENAKIT